MTLACRTIHSPFSFQQYLTDESQDLSVYRGWRIRYLGPTPSTWYTLCLAETQLQSVYEHIIYR
jgi:hypothetical protein